MGGEIQRDARVRRVGRRLERSGRPWWCRGVCYGPFAGADGPGWLPGSESLARDFGKMVASGFNAIRVFHPPSRELLNLAGAHGLAVWAGFPWGWQSDFHARPDIVQQAKSGLAAAVADVRGHPALAGWIVANEIEATMVRWIGRDRVRGVLEEMCRVARSADPGALVLYANYPPTEYLLPDNADIAGLNLYLENEDSLRRYLRRAHHLAGELPLLITEFGLDRLQHGAVAQANWLERAFTIASEEGAAGMFWFTWSDAWRDARTGGQVMGWKFGLVSEAGEAHPALAAAARTLPGLGQVPPGPRVWPKVSVLICTRNGRRAIPQCLAAVSRIDYPDWEVVVVDDGSDDGTGGWVKTHHPDVRVISSRPIGLGAARNLAAASAKGEILAFLDDDCEPDVFWLRHAVVGMERGKWDIAGGPNLAPPASRGWQKVLDRLPGLAVHVMLDDSRAEHLPGCNLIVRASFYRDLGGFDPRFHTAGDDVDFCWRAMDAGSLPGFLPAAVVWHHRRSNPWKSIQQQIGYGRAETQLAEKWSDRVGPGGARWRGAVYGPGRGAARVYRGPLGYGDYPSLEMAFTKPRPPEDCPIYLRWLHAGLCAVQPWSRAFGRWLQGMPDPGWPAVWERPPAGSHRPPALRYSGAIWHSEGRDRDDFLAGMAAIWSSAGARVEWDDGWQEHDLAILPPAAPGSGEFFLATVTEYTENPGRLTRWRLSGHPGATRDAAALIPKVARDLGFQIL